VARLSVQERTEILRSDDKGLGCSADHQGNEPVRVVAEGGAATVDRHPGAL